MRAQALAENCPIIPIEPTEDQMMHLMDIEVEHCAAVIVAAFLNPCKQN